MQVLLTKNKDVLLDNVKALAHVALRIEGILQLEKLIKKLALVSFYLSHEYQRFGERAPA